MKTHRLTIKTRFEGRETLIAFESPTNASRKEIRRHGHNAALDTLEITFLDEQQASAAEGRHALLSLANIVLLLLLTALAATVVYTWFDSDTVKRSLAFGNTGTLIGILLAALSAFMKSESLQKWLIGGGLLLGAPFCWLAMASDFYGWGV